MHARLQSIKPLIVALLALLAAVLVTLAAIQIRVWRQPQAGPVAPTQPLSDREKLDILASLASTSTLSAQQKKEALRSLSAATTSGPTEEKKLDILRSLRR